MAPACLCKEPDRCSEDYCPLVAPSSLVLEFLAIRGTVAMLMDSDTRSRPFKEMLSVAAGCDGENITIMLLTDAFIAFLTITVPNM